jgi:hypothetical protein
VENVSGKIDELRNVLRFGEIEYIEELVNQLLDNHTDMQRLSRNVSDDPTNTNFRLLHHAFSRTDSRTETFLMLINKIISEIAASNEKAELIMFDLEHLLKEGGAL